jgi:hypothetical protein
MTLRINKNAGKGSGRRSTQNDSAYLSNYDAIFGKKPKLTLVCPLCKADRYIEDCKGESMKCPMITEAQDKRW